jgi:wyosine [tRNA(Phe)-imidazoG37] synthetase (radical SAM superfamily)
MLYVYGPVPSRRLGFSLGIDVVPFKACSLDCIYCQLGRTTHKTVERKPYTQGDVVCREIQEVLNSEQPVDYITFSGSGEPTLNAEIGALIRQVKTITNLPVVVLTNGTLLFREDVRKDLFAADVVMPSLDAASGPLFRKINRPHPVLNVVSIIRGLQRFRDEYAGKMWLEVMLIRGFNDDAGSLSEIRNAISAIGPDKVYLNTVVRPPSEKYAKPLNRKEMLAVKRILGRNCEVIAGFHGRKIAETKDVAEAIVEMAKRRPLTITDIANVLGISDTNAQEWVKGLLAAKKLRERLYKGKKYYSFAGAELKRVIGGRFVKETARSDA